MLPKWKDIEPMVLSLLKGESPDGALRPKYDPDDVVDWWNNAQIRLATAKPQPRHQVYKCDDGAVVAVPRYFYKPRGVYVAGGVEIPQIKMQEAVVGREGYYVIGDDLIMALGNLPAQWSLIYDSYFPSITRPSVDKDKNSSVHVPLWAQEACAHYVGVQAMIRESVADARYRKFTSPEDAGGNPTHNPFLAVAKFMRERFYEIINMHSDDDTEFRQ
jgi:hypothetical protein